MKFGPVLDFQSITPQTTKGDIIGRTTVGATRVAVGADNTVLTADSSTALGIKWASAVANLPVNTLTGATTLPATSQVVLVSGTTFAITFPVPTSNSGLQYIILKTDSGLVTPISIANSNGVAGVTLQTQLEEYQFICDGATYWPISHKADTPWTTYTPTFGGFGTVTAAGGAWKRSSDSIEINNYWACGTVSGLSLASFTLPAGAAIDAAKFARANTTGAAGHLVGSYAQNATGNVGYVITATGTTSTLIYFGQNDGGSNNQIPLNGNSVSVNSGIMSAYTVRIPILGWGA